MRAIGSSVCAGGVMTMLCQSMRHPTQWEAKHDHQFVGWVMAHDILPENSPLLPGSQEEQLYPHLVEAGHLWADQVTFLPYWKPSPFTTSQPDCLISAHTADGRALLWIVNKSRADANVAVTIDWKSIGMDPAKIAASNAETGEAISITPTGLKVTVPQRDFVPVLLCTGTK
jgi:hypothetical protein